METDPVALELNVDAALVLKSLVGIDAYPSVLALLPNIFSGEDRKRVHAIVLDQLADAGIVENDRVHPHVVTWLEALYRPDMELTARVMDFGSDQKFTAMLRMALVRAGNTHVLALRCDDEVVIQPVFHEGAHTGFLAAALESVLGDAPTVQFEPITATVDLLSTITEADPDSIAAGLRELGAERYAAKVVARTLTEVTRRAEILITEHHDGGSARTERAVTVIDSAEGRIIATPRIAIDGKVWSTVAPGDTATLHSSITGLLEMLPGKSWFDTSRA